MHDAENAEEETLIKDVYTYLANFFETIGLKILVLGPLYDQNFQRGTIFLEKIGPLGPKFSLKILVLGPFLPGPIFQ